MFCPYCGKETGNGNRFCTNCGREFPARMQQQAGGAQNQPRQDWNGRGTINGRNYDKGGCGNSGYGIQDDRDSAVKPQGDRVNLALVIAVGVLALVVFLGALGAFLMRDRIRAAIGDRPGDVVAAPPEERADPSPEPVTEAPAVLPEAGQNGQIGVSAVTPTPEPVTGYAGISSRIGGLDNSGQMSLVTTDVSSYPNVRLYVSYNDPWGQAITLESPTAGILESINGGGEIEREIRSIERMEGNEGVGFDILVDKSASMSGDLAQMQSILRDFVISLDYGSGDQAEIIAFDTLLMYMCTYTDNRDYLLNGIDNMATSGDTALYDALYTGIGNAASRPGANCVIAFTDGEDNRSACTAQEVIGLAQAMEIPVYLIGTGGASGSVLSSLADATGGQYWNINSISSMDQILLEIYHGQKNMYCIEYQSDPNADPYAQRSVSCALMDSTRGAVMQDSFTPKQVRTVTPHSSRYEILGGDISWTEANRLAIERGGHLATITSQQEMDTITGMAAGTGYKYLWIGGYTSVRDGAAFGHWTTGEPFDFTAWYPGEPSRTDKNDGIAEAYLMLWYVDDYWSWNDQRDDPAADYAYFHGKTGYVIEYEY